MLCFLGNILGALAFFLILRMSDSMTPDMMKQLSEVIHHKTMTASFLELLAKGIFANFFINISLVIAMQIDDILAKMFVMMFGVAVFAFMGYEHVVYNANLFSGMMFYNLDALSWIDVLKNIVWAFVGNYIGGGIFVGLLYAFFNGKRNHYIDEQK